MRELLLGMARYALTAQALGLCRLPLSCGKFGIEAPVVEWAVRMKADFLVRRFYQHGQRRSVPRKQHHRRSAGFPRRFDDPQRHRAAPRPRPRAGISWQGSCLPSTGRGASTSRTNAARVSARPSSRQPDSHLLVAAQQGPERDSLWCATRRSSSRGCNRCPKPVAIMVRRRQAYHIIEACLQRSRKFARPQRDITSWGRQRRDDMVR